MPPNVSFCVLGVLHQHHLFAWVLQLYHVQQVLNVRVSLFPCHFRLLALLLRPACWKVCGLDTQKFHQFVVGITEKDYAVFILVFAPLLFFIFLVLLSSFARRIQRKYAQDILSIASICCVCLSSIGIIQSFLNLTALMRPRDWNIYLKIYVLKLGKWLVFLPSLAIFWIEAIYLCCMLLCCYVIYVIMFFVLFFFFFFVCLLHSLMYFGL